MPIIEAYDLTYSYKITVPEVKALNHLDLQVEVGEMVAIQGPSGSGKSTLLHILGCMLAVQKGKVYVEGLDVSNLSSLELAVVRNQRLGFIFQEPFLLARTNVLDNILLPTFYPCEFIGHKNGDRQRAIEYSRKLGIEHRLNYYPNKLSSGEQQRVCIARALIRKAKILLADEPTGNLDFKLSLQIINYLKKLQQEENFAIVLVTHDNLIAKKADRILRICDGALRHEKNIVKAPASVSAAPLPSVKLTWVKLFISFFKLIPYASKNIFINKVRSLLTMLGIVIGIAAMLAMMTVGQFTKDKILASYAKLGANTLAVWGVSSWQQLATYKAVPMVFNSFDTEYDIKSLTEIFPRITMVSPLLARWDITVSYANRGLTSDVNLLGVGKDYLNIVERKLTGGENFKLINIEEAAPVCIIGSSISEGLFVDDDPINKIIYLNVGKNYFTCKVQGMLAKSSTPRAGVEDVNMQILVPYTYLTRIDPDPWLNKVTRFLARVKNPREIQSVGEAVMKYFRSKYGSTGIFDVDPDIILLAQMRKFLNLFTFMLAAISIIALVISGIGITNMMLVSISEQYKEIGLKKALGATDSCMKFTFLIQSTILCLLAGIVGLILGFGAYEGIIYVASKVVQEVDFELIVYPPAVIVSIYSIFMVGIFSGLNPALKAERLDIITALRSE